MWDPQTNTLSCAGVSYPVGCVSWGTQGCIRDPGLSSSPPNPPQPPNTGGGGGANPPSNPPAPSQPPPSAPTEPASPSAPAGPSAPSAPAAPSVVPRNGILTKAKNLVCSAIPDARTVTITGGVGAIGSIQGSLQASLNYRTGQTSFSANGGFQLGWNGILLGQVSAGFIYGSSSSNRSVSYSGGAALSGYVSTSGNAREYGMGVGVSLTEGIGGGRTVSLSSSSIGHVMGLETPLDSALILAKQVCP